MAVNTAVVHRRVCALCENDRDKRGFCTACDRQGSVVVESPDPTPRERQRREGWTRRASGRYSSTCQTCEGVISPDEARFIKRVRGRWAAKHVGCLTTRSMVAANELADFYVQRRRPEEP